MDLPGVQASIFVHGRKEKIFNTDCVILVLEVWRNRSLESDMTRSIFGWQKKYTWCIIDWENNPMLEIPDHPTR